MKPLASPTRPAPQTVDLAVVIGSVYIALLGRWPTMDELTHDLSRIAAGTPLYDLMSDVIRSRAFSEAFPSFQSRYDLADERLLHDISQFGEIALLLRLIIEEGCHERVVVDVGARGRGGSNSYDLLKHLGWKGLLIEANPALIPQLERDFSGLDCRIVQCAITDQEGSATLTLGLNDDVSSLNADLSNSWGPNRGTVEVPTRRLPLLLQEHDIPRHFGLLSLDIEGEDIKALDDLIGNSPYRPSWIIIEASLGGSVRTLHQAGCSQVVVDQYEIVAWTMPNLILGRRDRPGRIEPALR